MPEDPPNLNQSFAKSITGSEIAKMGTNFSEMALDAVLKDGMLKDIPVINSVISLYNVGVGIRESFLIKKLYRFLFELKDIPAAERTAFLEKMESKESFQQDVVERLLILIDRIDNIEKSDILGKLFAATIIKQMELHRFFRLTFIVERAFLEDLKVLWVKAQPYQGLKDPYRNFRPGKLTYTNLVNLGLMDAVEDENPPRGLNPQVAKAHKYRYQVNLLGADLARHGFAARPAWAKS